MVETLGFGSSNGEQIIVFLINISIITSKATVDNHYDLFSPAIIPLHYIVNGNSKSPVIRRIIFVNDNNQCLRNASKLMTTHWNSHYLLKLGNRNHRSISPLQIGLRHHLISSFLESSSPWFCYSSSRAVNCCIVFN